MGNILKNSFFLLLGIVLIACSGSKSLNQVNLAENYIKSEVDLNFETNIHNMNDSISNLHLFFDTDQLLFSKNSENQFIARYSISYKVYTNYNNNNIIDSSQIHYSITQDRNHPKQKNHNIKVFAPLGTNYIVQIIFTDENRGLEKSIFNSLKKENLTSSNYFKIESLNGKTTGYYQKDSFNVYPQSNSIKYLKVLTFKRQHFIAPKPHDLSYSFRFLGEPDSSWILPVQSKQSITLPPLLNGFYHFIPDTNSKKGFSVFYSETEHPKITNLQDAIGAMGYLLPQKEYARLITSTSPRVSFEIEWKKIGGGKERARNLIREYYKSVATANELFTSYKPGWSTDRGMVYIVYGPPKIVYRYDEAEIWIYGEENNLLSDVFKFQKIDSSIAENIYVLERNINYKVNWNRMVTSWKEDKGF